MRKSFRYSIPVHELDVFKCHLRAWADSHALALYLDSNTTNPAVLPTANGQEPTTWECLVAAGGAAVFQADSGKGFEGLQAFYDQKKDWLFGFFGYDLKNETEKLESHHPDGLGLPDLFFFQPEIVVGVRLPQSNPTVAEVEIHTLSIPPESVVATIQKTTLPTRTPSQGLRLLPRMAKPDYLAKVQAVREHIVAGDVYELNLCQEFFAEDARIEPLAVFERLNARARAPFSAYLRLNDRYLLCASPERFLKKQGDTLISQPIKGTRRRLADATADAQAREDLRHSEKDRAENVMIVDLVRNDLARNCLPGTVRVAELFGVYSFPTVHQMISTICGTLRPGVHPIQALRDAFPMGSMTGAPKVMAMALIERYEHTRRGLYSGAVGYFAPNGDFDFNVVIRSILHNAATGYLSCQVGGAIVYDSVPEQEYEECLTKLEAMEKSVFGE